MRQLTYTQAINEALVQAMEISPDVVVLGQLVDYKSGIFGTTTGLVERFGPSRVQDFPVAEGVMTSAAIGMAVAGKRPVLVHQRLDFMMYSLDAIVNWLSLWRFKSDGLCGLPITIRAVVGKGWGQGPQHSKSLHAWFSHLPGIRVAVPAKASDAKGLLLESIFGEDPTIIIEHRSLFSMTSYVPEPSYRGYFGRAAVCRQGVDVTMVALGAMVPLSLRAADELAADSIDVEVIDLRTVSPVDRGLVLSSVSRTKRLVVVDPGWYSAGIAAEIISSVCEKVSCDLLANPIRICLPDSHVPMSSALEDEYYPDEQSIVDSVRGIFPGTSRISV